MRKTLLLLSLFSAGCCPDQCVYEMDSAGWWQKDPQPQHEINQAYRERGIKVRMNPDWE